MRGIVLGLVLALGAAGAAWASDFVVVSSSDPGIRAGQGLDAGAHLNLGPGRSLTIIRTSGEVMTVQGSPRGVVLPASASGQNGGARLQTLQALFQRPPAGRTFGAQRGFCPGPAAYTSMDAIITAFQNGCQAEARKAMNVYLQRHGVSGADLDTPPAP
ncbi:MAG TPA: hypothetical protein VHX64_08805 [Caulobacteraceae bacterium]|jgi:hypothetical protein|nr:hypothetical protein [Caulobacteraceae bacterium]